MRGPKNVSIAHKKIDPEMLRKRTAEKKSAKPKPKPKPKLSKKNSGAPKRPPTAFFVFMEDFRKTYKEKYPDSKSVAAVSKAGGEKWRSMPDSEKAPYVEKAAKKKAEMAASKKENENSVASDKSTSEVNDVDEDEANS